MGNGNNNTYIFLFLPSLSAHYTNRILMSLRLLFEDKEEEEKNEYSGLVTQGYSGEQNITQHSQSHVYPSMTGRGKNCFLFLLSNCFSSIYTSTFSSTFFPKPSDDTMWGYSLFYFILVHVCAWIHPWPVLSLLKYTTDRMSEWSQVEGKKYSHFW